MTPAGRRPSDPTKATVLVRVCRYCHEIDHSAMYGPAATNCIPPSWDCRWCRCPLFDVVPISI